jgi:hypothetical protein
MDRFAKLLSIPAAIFLILALAAPPGAAGGFGPGKVILAQAAEPTPGKAPAPEAAPAPAAPSQPMPPPQAEKMQRRTRGMGHGSDDLERAGTKKLGGEVIRAKETPPGE